MGLTAEGKVEKLLDICKAENISPSEVAYIGDDINCISILKTVGIKACPANAHKNVKAIPQIIILSKNVRFTRYHLNYFTLNLYPIPQTVAIDQSLPSLIFSLIRFTCTSTVRVSPI